MRRTDLDPHISKRQMPPQKKPVDSLAHYMKMKKKERKQDYDYDLDCVEGGKGENSDDDTDDEATARGKRRRKCSGCGKMTFHNIRTCPDDLGRKRYYWKMRNKRIKKHAAYREMMQRQKK